MKQDATIASMRSDLQVRASTVRWSATTDRSISRRVKTPSRLRGMGERRFPAEIFVHENLIRCEWCYTRMCESARGTAPAVFNDIEPAITLGQAKLLLLFCAFFSSVKDTGQVAHRAFWRRKYSRDCNLRGTWNCQHRGLDIDLVERVLKSLHCEAPACGRKCPHQRSGCEA
jgi:hypothetical protein